MINPYDWQEGIGNRGQYIESRLKLASPVLAISLSDGVLMYTAGRNSRKLYEVYDKLMVGLVGQQSDVESLRTAAVDFAHQEGFNRSVEDVTLARVASALSKPIKKAFSDFSYAPIIARGIFAEVANEPKDDLYYTIEYDGDFQQKRDFAAIAGTNEAAQVAIEGLEKLDRSKSGAESVEAIQKVWSGAMKASDEDADLSEWKVEAVILSRNPNRENRFTGLRRDGPLAR